MNFMRSGICVGNVNELAKYGLIDMDDDGFVLQPLGKSGTSL